MKSLQSFLSGYSLAIRAAISVFAVISLHLLVLREALLGPLSGLADVVFFTSLTLDLAAIFLLSTLASRALYLLLFTGFWVDQLSLTTRFISWISKRFSASGAGDSRDLLKGIYDRIEVRGGLIELSLFLVLFLFLYIGGELTIQRSIYIVGGVLMWAIFTLQILSHFEISLPRALNLSTPITEPRKFGIIVALFSVSALTLSIFTALARAQETLGANVVWIERLDGKEYNCVSLIGKSAAGVFLFEPTNVSQPDTAIKFLPYSSFQQVVSVGGSEFFWMRLAIPCGTRGPGMGPD